MVNKITDKITIIIKKEMIIKWIKKIFINKEDKKNKHTIDTKV